MLYLNYGKIVCLKFRKIESQLCFSSKAEDETYIHLFHRCRKTSILWRHLQEFISTALNLPSVSPQSAAIFGFLDDTLEHKLLINHILIIFKIIYIKLEKTKILISTFLKTIFQKLEILKLI